MGLDFQWSFSSFKFLLQTLTGVSLFSSFSNSSNIRWKGILLLIYSGLMLLINISINVLNSAYSLVESFCPKLMLNDSATMTAASVKSVSVMELSNEIVYCLGVHATFLIVSFCKPWHRLWDNARNIQKELNLDDSFYRTLRKVVYISSSIIALVGYHQNIF